MAKKAATLHVRRVRTKEDRMRPSVFSRLKTGEFFKGHALFEPDPELEDNPGYYEYYDHYDRTGNAYVPCAGDNCPFCAVNDNPSTRALTVWYFPDNEKKEQLKVFTMNFSTINAVTDESEDEDGIMGKVMRIKRLSDKGEYRVKVLSEKALTKRELAAVMKEVEALNLPEMVERQLSVQMERLKAIDALDDTDDEEDEDEDEVRPPKRRGKAIKEEDDDDEDEDEDEEDEDEDDEEDDEDEDEDEDDEDEEDENEDEDEDEDESEDEEETITGSYEVVKGNSNEETFDLKDAGGKKVKMWVGEGVEVDYDEYPKGQMVTVEAMKDEEGDWILTKVGKKRGRKPVAK